MYDEIQHAVAWGQVKVPWAYTQAIPPLAMPLAHTHIRFPWPGAISLYHLLDRLISNM